MEVMLCGIESVRRFAELWLSVPVPDKTALLNFRRLPERYEKDKGLFNPNPPTGGRVVFG